MNLEDKLKRIVESRKIFFEGTKSSTTDFESDEWRRGLEGSHQRQRDIRSRMYNTIEDLNSRVFL